MYAQQVGTVYSESLYEAALRTRIRGPSYHVRYGRHWFRVTFPLRESASHCHKERIFQDNIETQGRMIHLMQFKGTGQRLFRCGDLVVG